MSIYACRKKTRSERDGCSKITETNKGELRKHALAKHKIRRWNGERIQSQQRTLLGPQVKEATWPSDPACSLTVGTALTPNAFFSSGLWCTSTFNYKSRIEQTAHVSLADRICPDREEAGWGDCPVLTLQQYSSFGCVRCLGQRLLRCSAAASCRLCSHLMQTGKE